MFNKSLFSVAVLAGLLASAGCGGGGGGGGVTSSTPGGGTSTPPGTTPVAAASATATFHVDVASRKVTIQSLTGATSKTAGSTPHAIFTGSAVGFTSSALLDQDGDAGLKVLSVSITNHWGVPIGQRPDGAPTGLKVRFSDFTNVSAFSDLRPKTTVSTLAGTGSVGTADGPIGSAAFNLPVGVAAAGNGVYYVAEYSSNRIRKIANGLVSTLAGSGSAGGVNGAGLTASFSTPYGLAINPVDGALIVAEYGGARIRRITPDGQVTTVAGTGTAGAANGAGTAATFNQPLGVAVGSNGAIYVTEFANEDVRKIVLTGADPKLPSSYTVSKMAGSGSAGATDGNGSAASFNSPMGIAIAPDGVLYVADRVGERIRRIDAGANVSTIAGTGAVGSVDGAGNAATFAAPRGVAVVNGAVVVGDGARIRQVTLKAGGSASPNSASSWQVATLAGSGAAGSVNGTGDVATFTNAQLLTSDPSGNIVEADSSNTIRKITPNSGAFPIGVANGSAPSEPVQLSNADGTIPNPGDATNLPYIQYAGALAPGASTTAKNWNFVIPAGVTAFEFTTTVEADSSILAPPGAVDNGPTPTAPHNVGSPDVEIRTLSGGGISLGYVDGNVGNARFNGPEFIAVDQSGTLYLSDEFNSAIRRISTSGVVSTIAGHIGGGSGTANGAGNVAQFNNPSGVAVTPDGSTIYVADTSNQKIRMITLNYPTADPTVSKNWTVSTIAGTGSVGGTYGLATGSTATFNTPIGLTLDLGGNLYVTEYSGNRVRILQFAGGDSTNPANWQVSLFAGDNSGNVGAVGTTDSSGFGAKFNHPAGITSDRAGNIYVADAGNNRIRKITPDGKVTTVAGGLNGDAAAFGYADGPAQSGGSVVARFSDPIGLCIDSAGYLYVGDTNNQRIRRISPAGYTTTVAGTGVSGAKDGSGNVAQFNSIQSMAVAPSGTIYVGETDNNGVRLLQRIVKSGTQ